MTVPNRERAYVPERKLKDYLLSLSHPVGKSKARFFRGLRVDEPTVDQPREELRSVVQQHDVKRPSGRVTAQSMWFLVRSAVQMERM